MGESRFAPSLSAYLSLACAQVLVGSLVVVGKVISAGFPVFLASALRSAIGVGVLLPLLLWQEGGLPRITWRDAGHLFLIAFTGVFLFSVFLLYGLRQTSATEGGIIISMAPALLGLFAFFFMGERFTLARGLAIGLAVLGMIVLRVAGEHEGAGGSWTGNLLVFGATVGEALFTALGKPVVRKLPALAIATYVTTLGLVMFTPLAIWEARTFDFAAVPLRAWLPIVYYGIFVTAGAFLLWYWAIARVPASTAAVFLGILPISGVVLSYGLLGEQFHWSHLVGLAAVLSGIACITLFDGRAEPSPPAASPGD